MMMPRFTRKFGPIPDEAVTETRPGMPILAKQNGGSGGELGRGEAHQLKDLTGIPSH